MFARPGFAREEDPARDGKSETLGALQRGVGTVSTLQNRTAKVDKVAGAQLALQPSQGW